MARYKTIDTSPRFLAVDLEGVGLNVRSNGRIHRSTLVQMWFVVVAESGSLHIDSIVADGLLFGGLRGGIWQPVPCAVKKIST